MRSRYLKPSFWKNEELADCRFESRLLFQGLWGLADWCGRLEKRSKRIKAEIFPYDNVDIDACLQELEDHGFIMTYGEGKYLWVINFQKHQACHKNEKSTPSVYPSPQKDGIETVQKPSNNGFNTVQGRTGIISGNPVNCELLTDNCEQITVNWDTVQERSDNGNDTVTERDDICNDEPKGSEQGMTSKEDQEEGSQTPSKAIKQKIIDLYNETAEKREGWRKCSKIPEGEVGRMLTARCRDAQWVAEFPKVMEVAAGFDWMTSGKLITFLRPDNARKILDGEWGSNNGHTSEPTDDNLSEMGRAARDQYLASLNKGAK